MALLYVDLLGMKSRYKNGQVRKVRKPTLSLNGSSREGSRSYLTVGR